MKKIFILIVLVSFCCVFILPGKVYADTSVNVTVYISLGVVIAGASLFFSLAFSKQALQNKTPNNEETYFSALHSLEFQTPPDKDDGIPDTAMLKILTW